MQRLSGFLLDAKDLAQNHSRYLLYGLIPFVAVRLAVVFLFEPWDPVVQSREILHGSLSGDANAYYSMAQSFIRTNSFADFAHVWPPGYSLFLVGVGKVVGNSILTFVIVQMVIDLAIGVAVYILAYLVFRTRSAGAAATGLYGISVISAFQALQLQTETLFTLLLTISVAMTVSATYKISYYKCTVIGALLGAATMVRALGYYYIVVPFVALNLARKPLPVRVLIVSTLMIGFFLVLTPWQIRNLRTYGHYDVATSYSNLADYAAIAKSQSDGVSYQEAKDSITPSGVHGRGGRDFDEAVRLRNSGIRYILQHPLSYSKAHVIGVLDLLSGTGKDVLVYGLLDRPPPETDIQARGLGPRLSRALRNLSHELYVTPVMTLKLLIEYGLAAIGVFWLVKKREWTILVVLITTFAYYVILPGPKGYARFRIPIIPIYLVLAGGGVTLLLGRYCRRTSVLNIFGKVGRLSSNKP